MTALLQGVPGQMSWLKSFCAMADWNFYLRVFAKFAANDLPHDGTDLEMTWLSWRSGAATSPIHNVHLLFLAERDLIQFSIYFGKKFLNWFRTSCVVSITTVATWHIWTAYFWVDFEQLIIGIRQGNKRVEWQNDCGPVLMPKDNIRTRVVTYDTAKHFIIPTEAVLVWKI